MTRRFVSACVLALAFALILNTHDVQTYYDDAHFSLTYFMARACGYTPMQAYRLASADVSIDTSTLTEPVQGQRVGLTAAETTGLRNSPEGSVYDAQEPRVRFHAMRDDRGPIDRQKADAAIKAREEGLWGLAINQQNPGVYLHYVQDELPHAGYSSWGGHWFKPHGPTVNNPSLQDPDLPYGSTTDYLSHSGGKARDTVKRSLDALTRFMGAMSRAQRPRPCDVSQISGILSELMKANPVTSQRVQYASQVTSRIDGTPDVSRANPLVSDALSRDLQDLSFKDFSHSPMRYEYDASGHLAALSLDTFTLYGTLNVRLRGDGLAKEPVAVSVWTVPTFKDEQPYQLACEETSGTATFQRLPVGDLVVQTVAQGGTITRERILVNREEQHLVSTVPFETEQSRQCSQEAAKLARDLCTRTGNGSAVAGLSTIRPLEGSFDKQLADAERCRAARMTDNTSLATALEPAPQPPANVPVPQEKKAGGSGKAIAGVAVAAGGGVAAAVAVNEYMKTLQEQSSTSSSSSSGACISTRSCVVNVLSNSCSCAGAAAGPCNFSGTPGGIGANCASGTPCRSGLSCNNGRCEDRNGRCPF